MIQATRLSGRKALPTTGALPLDLLADRALAAAQQLAAQHLKASRPNLTPPVGRMAPELTGRTGHAVDERADLYVLGATLYEWATGRPPFEERDPLRLVREQLTRTPTAPIVLRSELPQALSDIILRLLEKEPERRYHSAQGLVSDLRQVRRRARTGAHVPFKLGERDFPALLEPSRIFARDNECERLKCAVDAAAQGERRILFICGSAGVGKTALLNELRPLAGTRDGRFVSNKFDQYSCDEPSVILKALAALGRLFLAEPERELAPLRRRILQVTGHQAGLIDAVPEFRLLLGQTPEPFRAEPANAIARLDQVLFDLLRVIASPERPLVLALDDAQWGPAWTRHLVRGVVANREIRGLVLAFASRDDLLPALMDQEQGAPSGATVERLCLERLGEGDIAQVLASILRLPPRRALQLARVLHPHTSGNPRDTVDLVNALRREGLLSSSVKGWRWDVSALQLYVGRAEVLDLLEERVSQLPDAMRDLLQVCACLRTELSPALARVASGLPEHEFEQQIALLAEAGLMVRLEGSLTQLRFLHDRLRQAVYDALPDSRRAELHLMLARRLAGQPDFAAIAAEQFLAAADVVREPNECRSAAALLREVAGRARSAANFVTSRRMLEAGCKLLDRAGGDAAELRTKCEIDLHLTLYGLGQLDEADAAYRAIVGRESDPLRLVDAACVQVRSLCNRGDAAEAIVLALRLLADLGIAVPDHLSRPELAPRFESMRRWVSDFNIERELARSDAAEPWVMAAAKMLACLCAPALLADDAGLACWIVLEGQSLWERYGPCAPLVVTLCRVNFIATALDDMSVGYHLGSHLLSFCEARGWESERWQCLDLFVVNSQHWFEPIEHALEQSSRAREGLLAGGDLQNACMSYRASIVAAFESAASLDDYSQLVSAALESAQRAGNKQAYAYCLADLQLLRVLRGETSVPGFFDGRDFAEAEYVADGPAMHRSANYHLRCAVACAVFGDAQGLSAHAGAGLSMLNFHSYYPTVWAYWLGGLAMAWRAHDAAARPAFSKDAFLVEVGPCIDWLGRRAADVPQNFGHMKLHLEAERAWALGDTAAAAKLFDEALGCVMKISRPWHRALICERAGRFQLSSGLARGGRQLLLQARRLYEQWGASAKVAQLSQGADVAVATTASASVGVRQSSAADEVDTLAVLRATQALSSERNPQRLRARVEEVLGSVTGATKVVLALWQEQEGEWMVGAGGPASLAQAVPLTALRYAQRTREPLLLADALGDDRFGRDEYFAGMERCSLMVVPILHQGMLRAMLVLENRAARGAFSTARLDAVLMIAGQLAVSLESAQLYERLERKVREQTHQLREAQSQLLDEARRAGMAQIATNVLHNVGNVLTSVNVSTHVLAAQVRGSRAGRLSDLAQLLDANAGDLGRFFEADGKGRMLPGYLRELAQALAAEREQLLQELARLGASVEHIKNVVAMQQSYTGASGVLQTCNITELIEDALHMQQAALRRSGVTIERLYAPVEPLALDKTRVMQILVNLIDNARQAMAEEQGERSLRVQVRQDQQWLRVSVSDSGCGIAKEHLGRIFSHGFTTKASGHGFGLHSCAVATKEMGGSLSVHSDGPASGATFTLELPVRISLRSGDSGETSLISSR